MRLSLQMIMAIVNCNLFHFACNVFKQPTDYLIMRACSKVVVLKLNDLIMNNTKFIECMQHAAIAYAFNI